MAIKPILFNTEMVKAILDGRKTQTRRLLKPHYQDGDAGFRVVSRGEAGNFCYVEYYDENELGTGRYFVPPYRPDDILYVRETWCKWWMPHGEWHYCYKASDRDGNKRQTGPEYDDAWETIPWKPSIHMPKEAARIFLRVTDVRAERLWKITEDDAIAEGATPEPPFSVCPYIRGFADAWERTLRPGQEKNFGWVANPWVWVIEFERTENR